MHFSLGQGWWMIKIDQNWVYFSWDNDLLHMKEKHIGAKETIAIIAAAYCWPPKWTDKSVIVYTDNITARAVINKKKVSRCRDLGTYVWVWLVEGLVEQPAHVILSAELVTWSHAQYKTFVPARLRHHSVRVLASKHMKWAGFRWYFGAFSTS